MTSVNKYLQYGGLALLLVTVILVIASAANDYAILNPSKDSQVKDQTGTDTDSTTKWGTTKYGYNLDIAAAVLGSISLVALAAGIFMKQSSY